MPPGSQAAHAHTPMLPCILCYKWSKHDFPPVVCIQQNSPPPPPATFLTFIPARGGGAGMLAGGIEKGRGGGVFWGITESLDIAKMKTQMLE